MIQLGLAIGAAALIYFSALALAHRFSILGMALLLMGIAFALPVLQ